jgi:hypothetical protein
MTSIKLPDTLEGLLGFDPKNYNKNFVGSNTTPYIEALQTYLADAGAVVDAGWDINDNALKLIAKNMKGSSAELKDHREKLLNNKQIRNAFLKHLLAADKQTLTFGKSTRLEEINSALEKFQENETMPTIDKFGSGIVELIVEDLSNSNIKDRKIKDQNRVKILTIPAVGMAYLDKVNVATLDENAAGEMIEAIAAWPKDQKIEEARLNKVVALYNKCTQEIQALCLEDLRKNGAIAKKFDDLENGVKVYGDFAKEPIYNNDMRKNKVDQQIQNIVTHVGVTHQQAAAAYVASNPHMLPLIKNQGQGATNQKGAANPQEAAKQEAAKKQEDAKQLEAIKHLFGEDNAPKIKANIDKMSNETILGKQEVFANALLAGIEAPTKKQMEMANNIYFRVTKIPNIKKLETVDKLKAIWQLIVDFFLGLTKNVRAQKKVSANLSAQFAKNKKDQVANVTAASKSQSTTKQ